MANATETNESSKWLDWAALGSDDLLPTIMFSAYSEILSEAFAIKERPNNIRTTLKVVPELKLLHEANHLCTFDNISSVEVYLEACRKFDSALSLTQNVDTYALRKALNSLSLTSAASDETIAELEQKSEAPWKIRYQYALLLNAWGHSRQDDSAKQKAVALLLDIKTIDRATFSSSAYIQGALLQAQRGLKIDIECSVAEYHVEMAMVRLNIPRRWSSPTKLERLEAVQQLAKAYLENVRATDELVRAEAARLRSRDKKYLESVAQDARKILQKAARIQPGQITGNCVFA